MCKGIGATVNYLTLTANPREQIHKSTIASILNQSRGKGGYTQEPI